MPALSKPLMGREALKMSWRYALAEYIGVQHELDLDAGVEPPQRAGEGGGARDVTNAARDRRQHHDAPVRSVGGLSGVFDQKRAFRFLYRRWSVASPRRQSQVPHPVNRLSGQELGKPHVRHCYALL